METRSLVAEHLDMVRMIAAQIYKNVRKYVELDDLISSGSAGLVEAAVRYEPGTGVPFAAFAYSRIRGAMYDELRRMCMHGVQAEGEPPWDHGDGFPGVTCALESSPSLSNHEVDCLREFCDALQVAVYCGSVARGRGRAESLLDIYKRRADDVLLQKHIIGELERAIAALPALEKHLVRRHCFDGKRLGEAGEEVGLSRTRSSRMYARAAERLGRVLSRWLK